MNSLTAEEDQIGVNSRQKMEKRRNERAYINSGLRNFWCMAERSESRGRVDMCSTVVDD